MLEGIQIPRRGPGLTVSDLLCPRRTCLRILSTEGDGWPASGRKKGFYVPHGGVWARLDGWLADGPVQIPVVRLRRRADAPLLPLRPWERWRAAVLLHALGASGALLVSRGRAILWRPPEAESLRLLFEILERRDSLLEAVEAGDPSLALAASDDPELSWLCSRCEFSALCASIRPPQLSEPIPQDSEGGG
mgnify:CR=1 FL=1